MRRVGQCARASSAKNPALTLRFKAEEAPAPPKYEGTTQGRGRLPHVQQSSHVQVFAFLYMLP